MDCFNPSDMTDLKKFLLVDANSLNQFSKLFDKKNTRLDPPVKRETNRLDSLMSEIVNNSALPENEKVALYNKTLSEFQNLRHVTQPSNTLSQQPLDKKGDQTLNLEETLIPIPKQYKNKAKNLFRLLNNNSNLKVHLNGEVSIDGSKLDNSNISDLLNGAVNSKVDLDNVPGWREFASLLHNSNVPKSMLSIKAKTSVKDFDSTLKRQEAELKPDSLLTPQTVKKKAKKYKPDQNFYTPPSERSASKKWLNF